MWKQYMETHAGLRHQTTVLELAHKDRQIGIHLPTSDPSARPKHELGLRFPSLAFCRGRFRRWDQKPAQRSLNYICVGNHVIKHSNVRKQYMQPLKHQPRAADVMSFRQEYVCGVTQKLIPCDFTSCKVHDNKSATRRSAGNLQRTGESLRTERECQNQVQHVSLPNPKCSMVVSQAFKH